MNLLNYDLTISIVLYKTDVTELEKIISLIKEVNLNIAVFLIDNSPTDILKSIVERFDVSYLFNNKNIGYGSGHNLAIKMADGLSNYHLVMNSDVDFDPSILIKAITFMNANSEVGLLSPKVRLQSGEMQHFCRMLPTPFDLFARRFIPGFLKPLLKNRLDAYILTANDYCRAMNIPNLPGCFMFMRVDSLKQVGGFDEKIFLYVEDIDLSRRLHEITKTVYYPDIEITHGLARGSYKFSKLVLYHIKSAIYYFNKWGWFFDKDRRLINNLLIGNGVYIKTNNDLQKVDYSFDAKQRKIVGI